MFHKLTLRSVKEATVALGLTKVAGDRRPVLILGSGFFVGPKGQVITARHVLDGCDEAIDRYKENDEDLEIAVLSVVTRGWGAETRIMRRVRTSAARLLSTSGYTAPLDPDIGIIVPGDGIDELGGTPFLGIKDLRTPPDLYDNVIICGYPAGDQSLDMFGRNGRLRLSPIIQIGHLTGFMPTDDVKLPWEEQTDIVATGGSSGSPIVDPADAKVIGIAQNVFVGEFKDIQNPST